MSDESASAHLHTIRQVVDRYLLHCQVIGTHTPEARTERERTFRVFLAFTSTDFAGAIGDLTVTSCRPSHLEDFIEGNERWRSSSTRKAKANQINAAFNWAAKGRRIDHNPFSGVNYPEADPRCPMPDDQEVPGSYPGWPIIFA